MNDNLALAKEVCRLCMNFCVFRVNIFANDFLRIINNVIAMNTYDHIVHRL